MVAAPTLPLPAEAVLRAHGVSFVTSLALGAERAVLDIDCAGRFRAWGAPGAALEVALAEMAVIETSAAGAPVCKAPRCAQVLRARNGRSRAEICTAVDQLQERLCVLALVHDAVHAPRSAPCLRAIGTVYLPTLRGASQPGRERRAVTYRAAGGGGVRTVDVDAEIRVVTFTA